MKSFPARAFNQIIDVRTLDCFLASSHNLSPTPLEYRVDCRAKPILCQYYILLQSLFYLVLEERHNVAHLDARFLLRARTTNLYP